jgi:hypothetical protein
MHSTESQQFGLVAYSGLPPQGHSAIPAPRSGHVMIYVHRLGGVVLYGGLGQSDDQYFSDTWLLRSDGTWTELRPDCQLASPPAVFGHCAALLPCGTKMIVFGGLGDQNFHNNVFYVLDFIAMAWSTALQAPGTPLLPAMWGSSLTQMKTADGVGCFVLFGGMEDVNARNELYSIVTSMTAGRVTVSIAQLTPSSLIMPLPRRRHGAVAYKDHFLFIFGGRDVRTFYNDLWAYDMLRDLWLPMTASMTLDMQRRALRRESEATNHVMEEYTRSMDRMPPRDRARMVNPFFSSVASRTGASMVLLDDTIVIFGGFSYDRLANSVFSHNDMHSYSITRHEWRAIGLTSLQGLMQPGACGDDDISPACQPPPLTMGCLLEIPDSFVPSELGTARSLRGAEKRDSAGRKVSRLLLFGGRVGDDPVDVLLTVHLSLPRLSLTKLCFEWMNTLHSMLRPVSAFPGSLPAPLEALKAADVGRHQFTLP